MLPPIEALKSWEIVLSIVTVVMGGFWFVTNWIARRLKARDERLSGQIASARASGENRLDELARRVREIDDQVGEIDDRVGVIERGMETVARQRDVDGVRADLRGFDGRLSAEMKAISGQVDTMYKAALAASQKRIPEL